MIELPWRLVDEGDPAKADILDAGGFLVADGVWLEQANQIVKAVNAYDTLVRELRGLVNHRMLYRMDSNERYICALCGERAWTMLDIPHLECCPILSARVALETIGRENER